MVLHRTQNPVDNKPRGVFSSYRRKTESLSGRVERPDALIQHQQKILCRLRIRGNLAVLGKNGQAIKAEQLFRNVKLNQTVTWHSKRKVSGISLDIAARRSLKGLVIVVATKSRKRRLMITAGVGPYKHFLAA